jgi:hypothetical protein
LSVVSDQLTGNGQLIGQVPVDRGRHQRGVNGGVSVIRGHSVKRFVGG